MYLNLRFFKVSCFEIFELDPAKVFSAPGLLILDDANIERSSYPNLPYI